MLQQLSVGIQSFSDLRSIDYLHVNKTEDFYRMITTGKPYFLSLLRRFGSSLFLSAFITMAFVAMTFSAQANKLSTLSEDGNRLLILQVGAATDGNIQRSFVELYNDSESPVNLNGYSLQYAQGTRVSVVANQPNTSTEDGAWHKIDLTGIVPPKHSFLILGDADLSNGSAPLPNPALKFESVNYGDLYVQGFVISNRSFKVALLSVTTMLTSAIQNPFDIDGKGTKTAGYIDMVGAVNTVGEDKINGFETKPVTDLNKQTGQRRTFLDDTDNNATDFARATYLNATPDNFEKWRPKNLAFGPWNPITGLKDIKEPEGNDPIVAGTPDALAGRLLILQAYGATNGASGASHSFVELYNTTDASINLRGITLYYADGTTVGSGSLPNTNTTDLNWRAIPLSGTLPAKTSFLILGPRQNLSGRLQIKDNYGDINSAFFTLNNRTLKVALIRNKNSDLTQPNPFNMDGAGAKAEGYIDMLGAAIDYADNGSARDRIFGFETAPAQNEVSAALRRHSLVDTDNNSKDFVTIPYTIGGINNEQLEILRPKNRVYGAWDAFTGESADKATGLPVIRIYTENEAPITSEDIYTGITFMLTDPEHPENNVFSNDPRDEMRGRGNVTWDYPKKPYRIRFRENTSLFGLAAYRNWILLAEFRDPTFLTTPVTFELGRNVFDYQPYTNTYHHVHVYLNGRYDGVYGFTEHRQASPDGVGAPGRVGIDPLEGWLGQMSIYYESPYFRTRNYNIPILIQTNNAPTGNPDDSNNPYYDFIKRDLNELCDLMVSSGFPENGYRDLIDLNVLVDYILVNELLGNTDNLSAANSVFLYKDKGGKIGFGPLWDFDISFGWDWNIHNHIYFVPGTSTTFIPKQDFFQRFFDDPEFLIKYKEHWNKKYAALVAISDFIDELGKKIRPAILQDSERWAIPNNGYNINYYNTNHAQLVENMIVWWKQRISWLNAEINKVDFYPSNGSFGSATFNNYSNISCLSFILGSYGKIDDMTLSFEKGDLTAYEVCEKIETPTGEGGYFTTINVRPKDGLSGALYNDVFLVNGKNQGNNISFRANLSFRVDKTSGAIAPAPTLASKTTNSITVNAADTLSNGQAVEFAYNLYDVAPTNTWRVEPLTFNYLKPNTSYYIFARSSENGSYLAGEVSASLHVTTDELIIIDETFKAYMQNRFLHINGLIPGETLHIYNAVGMLLHQSIATEREKDVFLNVRGLIIVRAGDRTLKVYANP